VSRKRDRRPGSEPADDGPWLDPGVPAPRLLLFAPSSADLEAALATGGIAAVIVGPHAADSAAARAGCRRHGVAFVLHGEPADVMAAEADGVHLDEPQRVAAARALLGRDRLVGAACGRSRHAAMVAGEAGADYVLFGSPTDGAPDDELRELVAWWSGLFVLPCAAAGGLTVVDARSLIAAGADLVAVRAGDGREVELARVLTAP
jgi:thiamine-phosphate pyrophosphorylase